MLIITTHKYYLPLITVPLPFQSLILLDNTVIVIVTSDSIMILNIYVGLVTQIAILVQ